MLIFPESQELPLGVVLQRRPGATRWAKWAWKATAVLPGAGHADWKEIRREGDLAEFHVATLPLTLYRSDTEAYVHELGAQTPSVYIVMRRSTDAERPFEVICVTASPYDAQDYTDSAEEVVERVPMPDGLLAWVGDYVARHHVEEEFVKRKRKGHRTDEIEDGKGDARIRQMADVYRAPRRRVGA